MRFKSLKCTGNISVRQARQTLASIAITWRIYNLQHRLLLPRCHVQNVDRAHFVTFYPAGNKQRYYPQNRVTVYPAFPR